MIEYNFHKLQCKVGAESALEIFEFFILISVD